MIRYPHTTHHGYFIQTARAFFGGRHYDMAANIYSGYDLIAVIAVEGDGAAAIAVAKSWLDLVFALDVQRAEQEQRRAAVRAQREHDAALATARHLAEVKAARERENEAEIAERMRSNMVSASRVGRRYDPRPAIDADRARRIRGY